MNRIQLAAELPVAMVDMVYGRRVLGWPRWRDALYLFDIEPEHPLRTGQRGYVEYLLHLRPEGNLPPRFRRVVPAIGFAGLKMTTAFSGRKLPSEVYWAEWAGDEPESPIVPASELVLELEPIYNGEPDPPRQAVWEIDRIASKVVGMRWHW